MARTRSSGKQLLSILAASANPIYVMDDRRQIVYCNEACAQWLDVPAEQLIGRRCEYQSGAVPADELAATLCPPPEAFSDQPVTASAISRDTSGRLSRRRADFLPLGPTSSDAGGVLAVVSTAQVSLDDSRPEPAVTAGDLHERLRILVQQVRGQHRLDRLAGESPAIERVRDQVRLAIQGQPRVLVVGPAGSGREQIARTIHCGAEPENAGPLMPLSSSSLDAELLQTTLLAFLRRCSEADSLPSAAVLFLDVDQLTSASQTELLAFLRLPTFELRTLVTSRRPLLDVADEGNFDRELALILSTLVVELPSLASRRQDIPVLAHQFVEEFNAGGGKQLSGFTVDALDRLGALPWDRDVDELAELVQEACRDAEGPWITEADLPKRVELLVSAAAHPVHVDPTVPMDEFLVQIEKELIERAMHRARGNKAQAARLLGIHRARLLRRLSQLGVE